VGVLEVYEMKLSDWRTRHRARRLAQSNNLRPTSPGEMTFLARYPYGVLTEQEGGVDNEAYNWEWATHVCRKHRKLEQICPDGLIRQPEQ
jgi:hypothetical protein